MEVPPIVSARLELISMSPQMLEALLEGRRNEARQLLGVAVPDDWDSRYDGFIRLRVEQMRRDPAIQEWLVRALVLRGAEREMVGHAGFHGPPGVNAKRKPTAVELGYTIFPPFRRRGLGAETAAALIRWAHEERGVEDFVASVAPDNAPSLAIVRRLGFVQTGEQWDDEDGLELVFELGVP
jgi:RimJ/RimL family protein N-acetyltransferase